jgi:uncharacterized protein YgbK (DUF1537 family)
LKSVIGHFKSEILIPKLAIHLHSMSDLRLQMPDFKISKSEVFAALPPPWSADVKPLIRQLLAERPDHKLIVLDDDPTGTQTVYDIPVLTTWDQETLQAEFDQLGLCFYILTNSRSLIAADAKALNHEIARNLRAAAGGRPFAVISRSDSTLRGHFPLETDVISEELGPFDATLIIPYFEAGGRYTIDDVHYVAEGDQLTPASETPFAKDAAFGYRNSNLCDWVEEKTDGRVKVAEVKSISLDDLRIAGPDAVQAKLLALRDGELCIVNAAAPRDLEVLAWATLQAENAGCRLMFRTAASFVSARLGLAPRELWRPKLQGSVDKNGGLIIVGSYVPKTTQQLESLLAKSEVERVEISVEGILDSALREVVLHHAVEQANAGISAGRDVVVFTSRVLVTGGGGEASLAIGNRVSEALVELLRSIVVIPRYIIAKGGITSSDLATRALGVKRAMVLGQILPGIPVWELGAESKFPGLPYVVFPGNVGGPDALVEASNQFYERSNETK